MVFHVLHVHVCPALDGGHRAPDVVTILDDRVAFGNVDERDLVAQGDGVACLDGHRVVIVHDPPAQLLARLHVLHHDHAHGVFHAVDQKLYRHFSSRLRALTEGS